MTFTSEELSLYLGCCLESMKKMADNSVDSIVTDPPYGLSFMGKAWDYDVPRVDIWREALRVLKPGGHLLAFAGTRTQHRMAVNIEDAGFEIRDMISWVYGSGFPKSHNISKAIDKLNGRKFEERYKLGEHIKERREALGITRADANAWLNAKTKIEHYESTSEGFARVPTPEDFKILKDKLNLSDDHNILVERVAAERKVTGTKTSGISNPDEAARYTMGASKSVTVDITAPATPDAVKWDGWGTSIKPAVEPITVARKPFKGTVAANVLQHGTGGVNIDGCRVGRDTSDVSGWSATGSKASENRSMSGGNYTRPAKQDADGRFPANLIHDGSPEVVQHFPGSGDKSAARFFYVPKTSKADRDEGLAGFAEGVTFGKGRASLDGISDSKNNNKNLHPTVKPTDLMRYLCRLVTPAGGVVLDPFMGSGSTGKAAALEGFRFVGCELSPEYFAIAEARIFAAHL